MAALEDEGDKDANGDGEEDEADDEDHRAGLEADEVVEAVGHPAQQGRVAGGLVVERNHGGPDLAGGRGGARLDGLVLHGVPALLDEHRHDGGEEQQAR